MDHAAFTLTVKSLSADGELEGLAAGYGNVDSHGETFATGAFTKSLRGGRPVAMLLHHDPRRPVGRWDRLTETPAGLKASGQLAVESSDGQQAYALLKAGALTGLSVGFKAVQQKAGLITEAELYEVSLVSVPSNPLTYISNVKALGSPRELEEHLRDIGLSGRRAKAAAAAAFRAADQSENEQTLAKAAERLADATRNISSLMGV